MCKKIFQVMILCALAEGSLFSMNERDHII